MKIKKRKKIWLSFVVALNILFAGNIISEEGFAKEADPGGATGFTYQLAFPDNQIEENIGYYKLKMTPNDHQMLNIRLNNPGKKKITVDVGINGAKTNQNGVLEYGNSTIENDASLKFDFTDIVTGPKSVDLEPGETKNLELAIQMPETSYDGSIAGGVQLMRKNKDDATEEGGSKIINEYAYVIAILLQETDQALIPELELNQVKADQDNARNAIFVNFSNVVATYLNDMAVEVQVTPKGKETVLYERKQTAMRMAPNTFINFPVSMNGEKMISGKYEAKILVTGSNDQKWTWMKEFEITKKDADKFNERDVGLVQEKGMDWQLIGLIAGGLIGVISVIFSLLVFSRKRKEKIRKANKIGKQAKKSNTAMNKKKSR
ncbi:hypothetical protein DOK67_0001206 [Enterococcus sp. DIV0212c]|uniref:DUF916 and DUF3324 domain-containing protein n=1 Tax=Enterococcus sp. DIV0212c TaxID=2230867 RepID=UPI001A9B4F92|nr:DUF916 and DUF3324 domain-containing protein [Enterococcus sp. DIV0212c]MBO1353671.1 DUF916 and DUF3324 domain-containing protein [Enterococcus sp. DIV0212c]